MGSTKDKITIKKNGVNVILDARKLRNESTTLYLKVNRYALEGSKPQEASIKLPGGEKVQDGNDEKEYWRNKLGLPREMDNNMVHR